MNPNRDAAVQLTANGLRVFPCNDDKTPRVKAWEQVEALSPFKLSTWDSTALPALPIGSHGMLVIDCDRKPNAPDGVEAFRSLCLQSGIDVSGTLIVETPSGGLHFYFKTGEAYGNSRGALPPGIDVRGVGGYVIAPGATLPDGRTYRVVNGSWDSIAPLPQALAGLLRAKASPTVEPMPATQREATERERSYALRSLEDEAELIEGLKPGDGRNAALNASAHSLGTMAGAGWIDPNKAAHALLAAATANGHVAKHGQAQTIKTIESGMNAGMAKPRQPLEEVEGPEIDIPAMIRNSQKHSEPSQPVIETRSKWPEPLNDDAYYGILGDFVRLESPVSEGDPNAMLIAAIAIIGSICGRGAYLVNEKNLHHPRLFMTIVGQSSNARKGTTTGRAMSFAKMIDPSLEDRLHKGVSSGEGLIEAIRDARLDIAVPTNMKKKSTTTTEDKGVADKRLLIVQGEFGQTLQIMARPGNTLGPTLRDAWDGVQLSYRARNNWDVCREPHVTLVGNITKDELNALISDNDKANGFGNRFLWVCAKRSKSIPFTPPSNDAALQALAAKAAHMIEMATHYGQVGWMPDAASLWASQYDWLTAERSGVVANMTSRAAPQTLRIALVFAILDGKNNIDVPHLKAALEVWRYCLESAECLFGGSTGNSNADGVLSLLTATPDGATRTMISKKVFKGNKTKDELQRILDSLIASKKARFEYRGTGPSKSEIWFAS